MTIKFANGDFAVQRGSVIQVFNLWSYPRLCVVTDFQGDVVSFEPLYQGFSESDVFRKPSRSFADDLFLQQLKAIRVF